MRLTTIIADKSEKLCIWTSTGLVPVERINRRFGLNGPCDLAALIRTGELEPLREWYDSGGREKLKVLAGETIPPDRARFAPLYRHPGKIWGIGLNYVAHAADLSEKAPTAFPASFMKPDTAIIGHGDTIKIPVLSEKTTAEAELGVIIGKRCQHVGRKDWLNVVAGFTTIIDMTAEDILRQNPRYLTLSKSFDTFFSFGPVLVTPDEIDDVFSLKVATVING